MSVSYWVIEGVGINVNTIRPYLNKEKLVQFLTEQLPDDELVIEFKKKRDMLRFEHR